MPRSVISFAELALRDLEEINAWYGQQGVIEIGERLVADVFKQVDTLADHPGMDRIVPNLSNHSSAS